MIINKKIAIIASLLCSGNAYGIFPLNTWQADDINLWRPSWPKGSHVDINVASEFGLKTVGFSACDQPCGPGKYLSKVNVFKVWEPEQNSLAMLEGFPPHSTIGQLAQELDASNENGLRGRFDVCGDLDVIQHTVIATRFRLHHHVTFGLFFPFTTLKAHAKFTDLTPDTTSLDMLTKELLTDNFAENVCKLGCLNLAPWSRTGAGDLAALLTWERWFPQHRPILKNVGTSLRVGMNIPTGAKADINDLLAIPFGNESFGFILGAGLKLQLTSLMRFGVDVEFLDLINDNRDARIKTALRQTDLLFLATANVLKDYGFTHRFNVFWEFFKAGFSASFTYQYWKHDDDRITLFCNKFSSEIANTARSLDEWTMHQFIYRLSYDCSKLDCANKFGNPYVAFFYKQPINGKNSFMAHTVGLISSWAF